MVKSLKFLSLPVFLTFFLVSCSSEYGSDDGLDLSKRTFYNEFMACTAGPDYSPTSMTEMIAAPVRERLRIFLCYSDASSTLSITADLRGRYTCVG
jgi:hypothetical protein